MAEIQYYGTGRRKTSTARVYLRPGDGTFQVNRKAFESYFPNETLRMIIRQPLQMTETVNKFDVLVNVAGGGPAGQAGAIRHGAHRGGCGCRGMGQPVIDSVQMLRMTRGHESLGLLLRTQAQRSTELPSSARVARRRP